MTDSILNADDVELLRDAPFNKHSINMGKNVSPLDNSNVDIGIDGIKVRLVQGINEPAMRNTLGRAVRATIGINPDAPPEEMPWEEMLKGGLQTALESQVVVFEVSGV